MEINPKIENCKFILEGNNIDTTVNFNYSPNEVLQIYKELKKKYGFRITRLKFQRKNLFRVTDRSSQYTSYNYSQKIVEFILLSQKLEEKGLDITLLIRDFNKSQTNIEIYDIRHTLSLAKLGHYYDASGYQINFFPERNDKHPDLKINNSFCDLKVRSGIDRIEELKYARNIKKDEPIPQGETIYQINLSKMLCFDIGRTLQNRLAEGTEHADVLFFDLSDRYLQEIHERLNKDSILKDPIDPTQYRCIFFSNLGNYIEDAFNIFSTYIDIDPKLWKLIGFTKKE